MGGSIATMDLQCKHCSHRWPRDAVVEAMLLHMQVDHDTDEVELDLVAVCQCGAAMEFVESHPTGGGFKDHFKCPACGATGTIKRGA